MRTREKKEVAAEVIDGYQIPAFTPTGRGIIIPSMSHIFERMSDEDELIETEITFESKDFIATVLAVGPEVSKLIEVGDRIQILPSGQWNVEITVDGINYYRITEGHVIGVFK
jgi:hypothetical protein